MAVKLADKIKERFGRNVRIEGLPAADWVLIDADDVIVHIFRPEVRNFYNLERMWAFGDEADRAQRSRVRAHAIHCDFLALLAFVAALRRRRPRRTSSVEQQLSSMLSGSSADVGIAALDLNTGETISIKGDTAFPMASTVKVAIAAAVPVAGRSRPEDRSTTRSTASRRRTLMERC